MADEIHFRSDGPEAYRFLSNMSSCVMPCGERSLEIAYQADKADTFGEAEWVRASADSFEAKRRGRLVSMRVDFDPRATMDRLLADKFSLLNQELVAALLATGDAVLVEDNAGPWGGRDGGANWLGLALMARREALLS